MMTDRWFKKLFPPATVSRSFEKKKLVKTTLDCIRAGMSLHGEGKAVIGTRTDAQLVKWMLDNRYVSFTEVSEAVHDGICAIGRNMYEWCCADPLGHHPSCSLSPDALGYAMRNGSLSAKEIALIPFARGETPEKYMDMSCGLLEKVMQQLRDGTAYFDSGDSFRIEREK